VIIVPTTVKKQLTNEEKELLQIPGDATRLPIVRKDLQGMSAFVLENVLSPYECEYLINNAEKVGFSFWNANSPKTDFRDVDTIECTHPQLASVLWERMKDLIDFDFDLTEDNPFWQSDIGGAWEATDINEHWLIGRYLKGGHFAPHTDGRVEQHMDHQSLYTVILYLNDCKEGGATSLMKDTQLSNLALNERGVFTGQNDYVVHKIPAAAGKALVFYHAIVHEGEEVGAGCSKYFIRTDVMYKRKVPLCLTEKDKLAFDLYQQAKELASDGKEMEATSLFMKAFKTSPALANLYQM